VRSDVTERSGPGVLLAEPPCEGEVRVDDPVLEVDGPHMADRAEPARGDEFSRQRDRRDPPEVEPDHGAYPAPAGSLRRFGHGDRFVEGVGEWLLVRRGRRGNRPGPLFHEVSVP
jgi:hypothetical protein